MNFVRTIVNSDSLEKLVNLPDDLKHQEVEVLIFPIEKSLKKTKREFNPEDYEGILHIDTDILEKELKAIRDEWDRF